jgi:hypothetical protein
MEHPYYEAWSNIFQTNQITLNVFDLPWTS